MDKTEQVTKIVRCYSCNVQPKGKECELFDRCSQYVEVQSILALIASEQKPMVEALKHCITCAETYSDGLQMGNAVIKEARKGLDAVLPKGEEK